MINSPLLHNFSEDKVEFFYPCGKTDCFRYQKWGVVTAVRAYGGFWGRKKEHSYHFAAVEKSVWHGNQCLSCSHFIGVDMYQKNESA